MGREQQMREWIHTNMAQPWLYQEEGLDRG